MVHAYVNVKSSRGYSLECPIPVVTALRAPTEPNLTSPRHQSRPLQAGVLSLYLFLFLVEDVVFRTLYPRRTPHCCHCHCQCQSGPLRHPDQYLDARLEQPIGRLLLDGKILNDRI